MAPVTSSQPISKRGIILFLLTLATILSIVPLPQYLRAKSSAQWPTASGCVTASQVEPFRTKYGYSYRGLIRYRYRVRVNDYVGSRFSFNRTFAAAAEAWQKAMDAYPIGKPVSVYYDPKDPAFAILEPGLAGDLSILYKMDVFLIAAFGAGLLVALYRFREPMASKRQQGP